MNKFIEINGKIINKDNIISVEKYAGFVEGDSKKSEMGFCIYIKHMHGEEILTETIEIMRIVFEGKISKKIVRAPGFTEVKKICMQRLQMQFNRIKDILGTDKIELLKLE